MITISGNTSGNNPEDLSPDTVNENSNIDYWRNVTNKYGYDVTEKFESFGEQGKQVLDTYGEDAVNAVKNLSDVDAAKAIELIEEYGQDAIDLLNEGYSVDGARSVIEGRGTYYNADGSPIWPPNFGFDGEPVTTTLEPGMMVDRYGYDGGYFVSPEGTSYTERALPIGTDKTPYTVFEVVKPVEIQSGKIAPWFGEKGGGIQYKFNNKISELLEQGVLRKVEY